MIVIFCTNPIFIHILPQSARLVSSSFRFSHRPPASGGEISTHSVNFPNGSCDLGNGRKGHQMSPDVKRCHQDLDFVNFVGINGLEMLWLLWLWHVTVLPRGTLGPQKPHMQWQNSEGVGVGAAGVHILSVSVSDIYIYIYILYIYYVMSHYYNYSILQVPGTQMTPPFGWLTLSFMGQNLENNGPWSFGFQAYHHNYKIL